MLNLFAGYDKREAAGYHTFCASVIERSSALVRITPLASMGLPHGSNTFTRSRFLVPHLMGYKGHAIFADACDMLMLGDLAELDAMFDPEYAVQVVQHPEYQSLHARKYVGTEMECEQSNYRRKNWASLCIFNCEHRAWRGRNAEEIGMFSAMQLLQFQNLLNDEIGALPPQWNVLIDEGQPREGAKLLHWTAGLPTFKHYRNARSSIDWFVEFEAMTGGAIHG